MTRRLTVLLLALAMVLAMCPAFTVNADTTELEPATLEWWMGHEPMPDEAIVVASVKEYVKEKLNLDVNMHFDLDQASKMATMLNAGQDVGVVHGMEQYLVDAGRGSLYPMTALLEEYAPDVKALFPETVWDCCRVNGEIYGVPSLKDNAYLISMTYNKTMADELGIDMSDMKLNNFRNEDYVNLLYEVKEKRDAAHPEWADYPVMWKHGMLSPYYFALEQILVDSGMAVCNIPGIEDVGGYSSDTVYNLYDTQEFLDFALMRQKLVEDGILLYDYEGKDALQYEGGVFSWVMWGLTFTEPDMFGDKFDVELRMYDQVWTDSTNYHTAITVIAANCSEPERAMMLINEINTDPELATMLRFGVEGEHWTYDADGKMTFEGTRNADPMERAYYYWYMASVGNITIINAPEELSGPDNIMLDLLKQYNDNALPAGHMGFVLDMDPIANEIAACSNVEAEYKTDLIHGTLSSAEEVEAIVEEFRAKLDANGVDTIVAEAQRQVDAWKAAKGE